MEVSFKLCRNSIIRRLPREWFNQGIKKSVRTLEKRLRTAITAKDKTQAEELFKSYSSALGKATQKGKYHLNTASRKIARIASSMNKAING